MHGGQARALTDPSGGVSDLTWSPDGKRIAFSSETAPEANQPHRHLMDQWLPNKEADANTRSALPLR